MSIVDANERYEPNVVVTGIISLALVLAIAAALVAGVTAVAGTDFFLNWVGTFFMCATPFQIMMAVVWEHNTPASVGRMSQPMKGIALTAMFLLAGTVVTPILLYTVGHGVLTPILIHYVIQSVGLSLLVFIVFGCWPICKLTDNKMLLGLGALVYCYILNFIIFKICYNYSFFEGAPFYTATIDPGGFFNGITALSFAVTAVAMVMVLIMFEMWPVPQIAKSGVQPTFGLIGTAYVLLVSALVYYLFVFVMGMEPMDFMVRGPVCIIFGAFLVDNMMQFQLFANLQQPIRGVAKTLVCIVSAVAMYQLYSLVLPWFVGSVLPAGPAAGYAKEAWVATAMLGITFPVINIVSGAFEFWPVKRVGKDTSALLVGVNET